MTHSAKESPASLVQIVSLRIIIAAILSLALLISISLAKNFGSERHFAIGFLKLETKRILHALHLDKGTPGLAGTTRLAGTTGLAHYRGEFAAAYAFRVFDIKGQVIASSNQTLFPPALSIQKTARRLPDLWLHYPPGSALFHLSGGQKHLMASVPIWIEIATKGDPAGLRYRALWGEAVGSVLIPVMLTALLVALFALSAVRTSLRPFDDAALIAEKARPSHIPPLPSLRHLPHEANRFGIAINQLLIRVTKHLSSQQFFFSRTIHELRTPLSVMLLEVNKIPGTRARRIERDIELLTDIIRRLLKLTRMDAIKKTNQTIIDLTSVVAKVSKHIDPLLQKNNCTLLLRDEMPAPFKSEQSSVRDAISNLIENAIKHTPEGTQIIVTCGPGSCVMIEDNGPGFSSKEPEKYFKPFYRGTNTVEGAGLGLVIAKNAAELGGGHVKIGTSPTGGARIQICFTQRQTTKPSPEHEHEHEHEQEG